MSKGGDLQSTIYNLQFTVPDPLILLVNPPIHDFAAFDLWSKPLGLLYVAAGLRAAGQEVTLLDCMDRWDPGVAALSRGRQGKVRPFGTGHFHREEMPKPEPVSSVPRRYQRYGMPASLIAQYLREMDEPDLVLVGSVMTYWYPGVQEVIGLVRDQWPHACIVLGGIYATLCPDHAQLTSGADVVVQGPGIARAIALAGTRSPDLNDADLVGLRPAYDLYDRIRTAAVLTSIGCPFRCTYCAAHLLQPRFARCDPDEVADEVADHVSRGARDIAFYDDALLLDPESHFLPLSHLLRVRAPQARFHTPNGLHPRYITLEVAQAMRDMGVATVRLSLESADEGWQQRSSRKVSSAEFEAAAEHLFRVGFRAPDVGAYLLVGCPGQAADDVERSIRFVHETGVQVKLAEYSPIPHTGDFAKAAKRLPEIADEPLLQNNTVYTLLAGEIAPERLNGLKALAKQLNEHLLK